MVEKTERRRKPCFSHINAKSFLDFDTPFTAHIAYEYVQEMILQDVCLNTSLRLVYLSLP